MMSILLKGYQLLQFHSSGQQKGYFRKPLFLSMGIPSTRVHHLDFYFNQKMLIDCKIWLTHHPWTRVYCIDRWSRFTPYGHSPIFWRGMPHTRVHVHRTVPDTMCVELWLKGRCVDFLFCDGDIVDCTGMPRLLILDLWRELKERCNKMEVKFAIIISCFPFIFFSPSSIAPW